jgi:hypothetical protein
MFTRGRILESLSPRNTILAACLFAVLVSFGFYAVEGNDYFGFNAIFALWAGAASFCVVSSLLTLLRILSTRTRMAALSEARTWLAIVLLCLGMFLAVKLAIEI